MADEALQTLHEIQKLLDCGLDKDSLSICVALIENGVNPEVSCNPSDHRHDRSRNAASQVPLLFIFLLTHLPSFTQALAEVVKKLRKQAAESQFNPPPPPSSSK